MRICVAFDRGLASHCIVRSLPKDEALRDAFDCSVRDLNSLLVSKSQAQLLDAIDGLPPLLPMKSYKAKRILSASVAWAYAEERLSPCRKEDLAREMRLSSVLPLRANELPLDALVEDYGYDASAVEAEFAGRPAGENEVLVVEPVADWMAIRNLASVAARLLGLLPGESESILEEAGFAYRSFGKSGGGAYGVPVFGFGARMAHGVLDPAPLCSMLSAPGEVDGRGVGLLGGEEGVFLAEEAETGGNGVVVSLCVAGCESQVEAARKVLSSLNRSFRDLSYLGEPVNHGRATVADAISGMKSVLLGRPNRIGWVYDESADLLGLSQPKIDRLSYASAIWYSLLFHQGKRIVICKYCGNASFSSERGVKKEFCSDSCRVRSANRRLEAEE